MDDFEWARWAIEGGFSALHVVGNILRWENYKSLFSLLQIGDGPVFCYDSGQGLCLGQYSYGGRLKGTRGAPTWDQLFASYGVSEWARAAKCLGKRNMDGEERMCADLQSKARQLLGGKDVGVLTAASPCNAKCADLLTKLAKAGNPKSFTVRYFRAYTNQSEEAYSESLKTLSSAGIVCLPVDPGGVDPNIWRGVKDAEQVVKWMQTYNEKTKELEVLSQQILKHYA